MTDATAASADGETGFDTRTALVLAAIEEFSEKGYHAASVNSICARAGFSRGAFYFYFTSKEELLQEAMRAVLTEFYDDIAVTVGTREFLTNLGKIVTKRLETGAVDRPPPDVRFFGPLPFHRMIAACDEFGDVRSIFSQLEGGAHRNLVKAIRREQKEERTRTDISASRLGEMLIVLGIGMAAAAELGFDYKPTSVQRTIEKLMEFDDSISDGKA